MFDAKVSAGDVKNAIASLKEKGIGVKKKNSNGRKYYELLINDREIIINSDVDLVALANIMRGVEALDKKPSE